MVSSRWWIGELRIVGFANVPSEMLVAIYLLHQFIHQIHRFSPPPRWTTGLIHLYAGQAKGVLQQANMSEHVGPKMIKQI